MPLKDAPTLGLKGRWPLSHHVVVTLPQDQNGMFSHLTTNTSENDFISSIICKNKLKYHLRFRNAFVKKQFKLGCSELDDALDVFDHMFQTVIQYDIMSANRCWIASPRGIVYEIWYGIACPMPWFLLYGSNEKIWIIIRGNMSNFCELVNLMWTWNCDRLFIKGISLSACFCNFLSCLCCSYYCHS